MNRAQYAQMFAKLVRNKTRYTECVKITRVDGQVYRFTAHDVAIRLREPDGEYYEYKSANAFSLTSLETSAGLVVSNMDIDGIIDDDDISAQDLKRGFFDNANVELFIAYWADQAIRMLPLRTSWVGETVVKGQKYKVDLRGIAQRLAQTFVQATSLECRYTFCDGGVDGAKPPSKCTLNEADYTSDFTVTSVESRDIFSVSIPPADHGGVYQWGKARFTSGNNAGSLMEILRQWENRVQLFLPLPLSISVGDTVSLVRGCNKSWGACTAFGNGINFGGEPFLSGSDMLTRFPAAHTGDEGG